MTDQLGDRRTIRRATWMVSRTGTVEEVALPNGRSRFRVKIADAGREPFIKAWFNDPAPAHDLLEGVQLENEGLAELGHADLPWFEPPASNLAR